MRHRKQHVRSMLGLMAACVLPALAALAADGTPVSHTGVSDSPWEFTFNRTLPEWKDGLPIGNGRIGAQCWGDDTRLCLTLDRGDVWDLRYQANEAENYSYDTLRAFVRDRQHDRIQNELSPDVNPLASIVPTRVSIGRVEIALPDGARVKQARLNMHRAEARWQIKVGDTLHTVRMYAHAMSDVIIVEMTPAGEAPAVTFRSITELSEDTRTKLGYPLPERGEDEEVQWCQQPMADGDSIVTAWTSRNVGDTWQLLIAIPPQNSRQGVQTASATLHDAALRGPERSREVHRRCWDVHWQQSSVQLPDLEMHRLWINGLYKLASSSRGGVPTNLQGLWPPDGKLPPWRGDYHGNMNVQECYWPAYSSNHLALTEPLDDWLIEKVAPANRALTKRFFGHDGLWIGTALDVEGRLIGGKSNWMTVQYWLGSGAWLSQHLWWHYRYTGDKDFLHKKAYPFMRDCMTFYVNVLERDESGRLSIPLSSSPEYFSNELTAWTPNPTCDLSLVRNLARWCIEAATLLQTDRDLAREWADVERSLAHYPVSPKGLMIQPGVDYDQPHRHPMHLAPIFPLGDLTIEGTDIDRALIDRSIDHWLSLGTNEWTGWSYPYASLICSRVDRANDALEFLDIYREAFIWPNGFHINGDYKGLGHSQYKYEAYTVEAEMAFTAAVNEMLLQSWGNTIRVFPTVPESWRNVAFTNLRAEGAVLVSARQQGGRVVQLTLTPEQNGQTTVVWRPRPGEPVIREDIEFHAGQTVTLVKPEETASWPDRLEGGRTREGEVAGYRLNPKRSDPSLPW